MDGTSAQFRHEHLQSTQASMIRPYHGRGGGVSIH